MASQKITDLKTAAEKIRFLIRKKNKEAGL